VERVSEAGERPGSGEPASAVRLLAFAAARDLIGAAEVELALEAPCTVAELVMQLEARWPQLAPFRGALRLAVNGEYARDTDGVAPGDEVALIPPVSGG
jgi:sulfur-carrier protein